MLKDLNFNNISKPNLVGGLSRFFSRTDITTSFAFNSLFDLLLFSAVVVLIVSFSLSFRQNVEIDVDHSASEILTLDSSATLPSSYEVTLEGGGTLYGALLVSGITHFDAHLIAKSVDQVFKLSNLKAGQRIRFEINKVGHENRPEALKIFTPTAEIQVNYSSAANNYKSIVSTKNVSIDDSKAVKSVEDNTLPKKGKMVPRKVVFSGKVSNNFFSAARKAGMNPQIISQVIKLFSYDINFQRDVIAGSTFNILTDFSIEKKPVILYASLNIKGKNKEIYRYLSKTGSASYFYKDGTAIKRPTLLQPVKFAKITSGYGRRMHPRLHYTRMHTGVDFSAPKGTPILAAADGVVDEVSSDSGYGKYIKVKHNNRYTTLYAHLSKYKAHSGQSVKQGDIIGYVGSTGLSTGSHLHYEVHVDGVHVNPLKVTIPKEVLGKHQLASFTAQKYDIEKVIKQNIDANIQVASR